MKKENELKLLRKLARAMRYWRDRWNEAEVADVAEEQGYTPEIDPNILMTIADDAEQDMLDVLKEWEKQYRQ